MELHPEFAYVLLVLCSTYILNIFQMLQVGKMRMKLKVFHPVLYSDKHPLFNCYQRAHQNTLENLPFLLVTLPLAGLRHPLIAAAFGALWIVARFTYSLAYYTGDPQKRMPSVIVSYLAQFALILCTISTGGQVADWF